MGLFGKKPTRKVANNSMQQPNMQVDMGMDINPDMQGDMDMGMDMNGNMDTQSMEGQQIGTPIPVRGKPPRPTKPQRPVKQPKPPKAGKPVKQAKVAKAEKPKKLSAKEKKELAKQQQQQMAEEAMSAGIPDFNPDMGMQVGQSQDYITQMDNVGYPQQQYSGYTQPVEPAQGIPMPMQVRENSEDTVVGGLINQMHSQLSMDWHQLAKETIVRSNGTVTDLVGFCSALNVATQKAKVDSSAIKMNYGKIVSLMMNKADPGFITALTRIVNGRLELIKAVRPFDAREASYNEYKVYVDFVDEALKYNLILVGVLQFNKPYITEGKLDSIDNKVMGRFPSVPEAIAIMCLVDE